MAKPSKKHSKPSKAHPKPPKAHKPKGKPHAEREPEVLNEAAVGRDPVPEDAAPPRSKRAKTIGSLDEFEVHLRGRVRPQALKEAVCTVYGGTWDPDRELAVLRMVKDDSRFALSSIDHTNYVAIAGADASAEPQQTDLADAIAAPAEEPAAPTLGEAVAAAQGQSQRISWPHTIGSSVLLMSVTGQAPAKAIIRNIHNHGTYVLYDLSVNGGTVDECPASRIGRDLDAEGEVAGMRAYIAQLERHKARGQELAQHHIEMQAEEKKLAEALAKHRKAMDQAAEALAEHARADAAQQDLRDHLDEPAEKPAKASRGAKSKAKPSSAEDKMADDPPATAPRATAERIAAGDVVEMGELTVADIQAAAINRDTSSTGKPQQVNPVTSNGQQYVLTDVQDGVAVLLRLVSKADWAAVLQPAFGFPLDVPMLDVPDRLSKGGKLCGTPVRIGRATRYIAPEASALLVRLPPTTPEPGKPTGKEAAAGE